MKSRRFSAQPQLTQAAANTPSLKRGMHGTGVAEVQNVLHDLGFSMPISFAKHKADGIYGTETEAVVRQFQQRHGLAADGIVGRNTIAALDRILVEKPYLDLGSQTEYAAQMAGDLGMPLHLRRSFHA